MNFLSSFTDLDVKWKATEGLLSENLPVETD